MLDTIKLHLKKNCPYFFLKKFRDIKVTRFYNSRYWSKKKKKFLKIINDINEKSFDEKLPKNFDDFAIKEDRATLEINNTCNLDCIMCKTSLATRKKGKIDSETLEIALQRLKEAGVNHVTLHTIGDPLANPRLNEIFIELRKYKIKTSISTNGLLMHKHVDTLKDFLDICPSIRFSIDGVTKKTYEKIRAKGNWGELIRNLDLTNKYLRTSGLSTNINMTISKDNFNEIGRFVIFFKKYVSYPHLDFSFTLVNSLCPDNSYFHSVNLLPKNTHKNKMCHMVSGETSYLLFDGNVSVCCRDYTGELIIGNIKDSSLEEIRKSKKLKALQKAHINGNLDNYKLCKTCFIVDHRFDIIFNGSMQYLIFNNPNKDANFFQDKANKLMSFFKNRKLSEDKFLQILDY